MCPMRPMCPIEPCRAITYKDWQPLSNAALHYSTSNAAPPRPVLSRTERGIFSACLAAAIVACSLSATSALADENWPQFRGPRGDGTSQAKGLPLTWSESEHVRWKTAIHDRGHSSPVVWEGQVWLTTATADGHRLFAVGVDRASGRILHDVQVFAVEHPQPIASLNSYASPTPVVEAGRVWVHFGTYGTACLTRRRARSSGHATTCTAIISAAPAPRRSSTATC